MRWSEETTVKFVGLYKYCECLWDPNNPNYRNRHMREAAYNKIVEEMALKGFGVPEAKQKVKNLQSTYSQELKKIEKSKNSVMEGGETYTPSLKWFAIMDSILKNAKEKIASKCKLEPCDVLSTEVKTEDVDEAPRIIPCEVSIHEIEEEYPPKVVKRPKTSNDDTSIKEAFQLMKTLTEMSSNRDEFTVYGEHIAHKLRNSGRSRLEVAIAQHLVDEVCFKLTMGEYYQQSLSAGLTSLHSEDDHT